MNGIALTERKTLRLFALPVALLAFGASSSGGRARAQNQPPICHAGGPYRIECAPAAVKVDLDAGASTDPDGDLLAFSWTTDCPGGTFDDPESPAPKLTIDLSEVGRYQLPLVCGVFLTVSDGSAGAECESALTVEDSLLGSAAFEFALFSGEGRLSVKDGAVITGDVYHGGDIELKRGARIDGLLFSSGTARGKGVFTLGEFPEPSPVFPALDARNYEAAISAAGAQTPRNLRASILEMAGGVLLVNGNLELETGGRIVGPGRVVARGKITLREGCRIEGGVALVSGGGLEMKKGVNAERDSGRPPLFFSAKRVLVGEGSEIEGAVLSLGDARIRKDVRLLGVVYARDSVMIWERAEIRGSVVGNRVQQIKKNATITHDASIVSQICSQLGEEAPNGGDDPTDERRFVRGDINADGSINISDAAALLLFLYGTGPAPSCFKAADADDDGAINVTDAIFVLRYLFAGGVALGSPFPSCGIDSTPDELTCEAHLPCE